MKDIAKRITSAVLAVAFYVTGLSFTSQAPSLQASAADVAGVTKTAVAETAHCDGGSTVPCPFGAGLEDASVNSHNHYECKVISCVPTTGEYGVVISRSFTLETSCARCGGYKTSGCTISGAGGGGPSADDYPDSSEIVHRNIIIACSHGETDPHEVPSGYYIDSSYGYRGTSSTFTVYPVNVSCGSGITLTSKTFSGQTAQDYALAGHTATINFSGVPSGWKVKKTVNGVSETLSAGTTSFALTVPAQVTSVSLSIVPVAPTVTCSNITKTYGDATFNVSTAYSTNSDGAKTYTSSDTSVATISTAGAITIKKAGTTTITVSTAATTLYTAKTTTLTLTVNKFTPTLSGVSATGISYGQKLSNSTISGTAKGVGGTTITGSYAWSAPNTAPTCANSNSTAYNYTFTPTDTTNYNNVTGSVKLTVSKINPVVSATSATSITYGQALSSVAVTGTANVPGSFSLDSSILTNKPNATTGTNFSGYFKPTDTTNYNTVSCTFTVKVNKATPVITSVSATGITYGQTLANSTITGTTSCQYATAPAGKFTWNAKTTAPTVADSNSTAYAFTFTPNDTDNYNTATGTVTLGVSKATPVITVQPTAVSELTYGQQLAATALTGTASVAGSFLWDNNTIVPQVVDSNNTGYAVTFHPTDTANYNDVVCTPATVTVNPATPDIPPAELATITASAITYGQTLADSTLTSTTTIAGHFIWDNPATIPTVDQSNTVDFPITFISEDSNYTNLSGFSVRLTINQATPVIQTTVTASEITYGQSLADSVLNATVSTPGHFEWADSTVYPVVADSEFTQYGYSFIPDDTVNWKSLTGLTITVKVNKADPIMTQEQLDALSASSITYEETLADSTLTGTASVPGHFEWVDNTIAPAVSDSETTDYAVVFIPEDTDNYNNLTGLTCKLKVNKATPRITTEPTASGIHYEQTLADSTISGEAHVSGTFRWDNDTIAPAVADSDTTQYTVIFEPDDTDNYETLSNLLVTVHIDKGTPSMTQEQLDNLSASEITYGQTLADSLLTGTASVAGNFAWVDTSIAPTVSDSEVTEYAVVFNPTDTDNYNPLTGITCKLKVNPATPSFTQDELDTLSATTIRYGQTLADSTLTGTVWLDGRFEWAHPETAPDVLDSGVTLYEVVFKPTDNINYTNVVGLSCTVGVIAADPIFTQEQIDSITASPITYPLSLGYSALTGTAPVDGNFAWADTTIVPTVADSEVTAYGVHFNPLDTLRYNSVTDLETTVKVNPGTIVFSQEEIDTITASAIYVGQTLGDSLITATTILPGDFIWNDTSITPTYADSNVTFYDITFKPSDINYNDVTGLTTTVPVLLNPIVLTDEELGNITATGIIYGQTLADSALTGTVHIPGHWEWVDNTIAPAVSDSDTTEYAIIYIPDDENTYARLEGLTAKVHVDKADITLTEDEIGSMSATQIAVGQTLADSFITGTTNLPGDFRWDDPTIAPLYADSEVTEYAVTFYPTDADNYNPVTGLKLKLKVVKITPELTPEERSSIRATGITYGQTLAYSNLTGESSVAGHFEWVDTAITPEVVDSDRTPYEVIFIPDDTATYNTVTGLYTTVTVTPKPIIITQEQRLSVTATTIYVGDTLADSHLSGIMPKDGETEITGSYAWVDNTITPAYADSNSTEYDVQYIPDSPNYAVIIGLKSKIEVLKRDIEITPEHEATVQASGIIWGQTLADSTLTGTAPVAGHFEWVDSIIAPDVADSGITEYDVVFVPDETDRYNTVNGLHTTVTVSPKPITIISEPGVNTVTASSIYVGQTLADSQLTGTTPKDGDSSIPGRYAWVDNTIAPLYANSNITEYAVVYIPDSINYATVTGLKTTIEVKRLDIELPPIQEIAIRASGIVWGQTLANSTITGTMPVAGHFEWVDDTITPDLTDSDITEYAVVFIPTDTNTYNNVTGLKATVNVSPAPATEITEEVIAGLSASAITEGQTLANSTITSEIAVAGTFTWADPSIAPKVADSKVTPYGVIYTPNDPHYAVRSDLTLTLEVKSSTPTPTPSRPIRPTPDDPDEPEEEVYRVDVASVEGLTLYTNYTYAKAGTVVKISTEPFDVVYDARYDTETIIHTAAAEAGESEGHYEIATLVLVVGNSEKPIAKASFIMPKSDVLVKATSHFVPNRKDDEPVEEPTEEPTEVTEEPAKVTEEPSDVTEEPIEVTDEPIDEPGETGTNETTGTTEPDEGDIGLEGNKTDDNPPNNPSPGDNGSEANINDDRDNTNNIDSDHDSGHKKDPTKNNPDTGIGTAIVGACAFLAAAAVTIFRKRK